MNASQPRTTQRARGQRSSHQFFLTDIQECQMFLDLVDTELRLSHSQAAERAFRNAEHAYNCIHRLLCRTEHQQLRDEIEPKLTVIASSLADFRFRLNLGDREPSD
jgi:hypothetical protein